PATDRPTRGQLAFGSPVAAFLVTRVKRRRSRSLSLFGLPFDLVMRSRKSRRSFAVRFSLTRSRAFSQMPFASAQTTIHWIGRVFMRPAGVGFIGPPLTKSALVSHLPVPSRDAAG